MKSELQLLSSHFVNDNGVKWSDFAENLKADYAQVWRDILCGYGAIIGIFVSVWYIPLTLLTVFPILILSACLGFFIAYISLFLHEGAHFNLHEHRKSNDFLCNIFVGALIGQDVARYRLVHWQHHLSLGRLEDPESSYFNPLTPLYLFKVVTGFQTIETILRRRKSLEKTSRDKTHGGSMAQISFVILNILIMALCFFFRNYVAAFSWVAGLFIFFPFFGALRNVLEHRPLNFQNASSLADNKYFELSLFARIFGGAGFRRHILHHWEPKVSYTCFNQMEAFLLNSYLRESLVACRTTYLSAFRELLWERNNGPNPLPSVQISSNSGKSHSL
jgi:fatty acid desaturase